MGRRDLPDMYTWAQGHEAHRASADILSNSRPLMVTLPALYKLPKLNLLNTVRTTSLLTTGAVYDYGVLIL